MQTIHVAGPAGSYDVPVHRASLATRSLQGAAIVGGLLLLRLFPMFASNIPVAVFGLVIASLGGGIGGIVYYATDIWRVQGGMRRTAANVVSLLAYCLITAGLLLLAGPALGIK